MKLIRMILICALGLATANPAIAGESVAAAEQPETINELIVEYFPHNYRTMFAVAKCESRGLHRNPDGSLIANPKSSARGVFQVLMRVHKPEMVRLGLNPNNDEDYIKYVRRLYDAQKLQPWAESKGCWKRRLA